MKWKRFSAVLTAAVCTASMMTVMPVTLAEAATLVSNEFEVNYDGWYSNSDYATLSAVAGIGAGGSRGMLLSGRTTPQDGASSAKGFYLAGGIKYDYSVQVYSETAETFRLSLLTKDIDSGEETRKELAVKKVQPGQWTTITATDTAAENSGDFTLTITTDSTNDFRFDNVKVTSEGENAIMAEAAGGGLKDEFANYFRIGNILNGTTINNNSVKNILLKDCNAIECENETKPWDTLVKNGSTDDNVNVSLRSCAAICDFCVEHNLAFRGHTMVWHSQTREWFFIQNFSDSGNYVDKNTMTKRMDSYIKNMFAAYEREYPSLNLYAYDVCNECISDDAGACNNGDGARSPGYDHGNSPWVKIYGNNSFIELAFKSAREHAPANCKLFYNDYNEHASYKRDCIYRTCKDLYEKGYLDGVGMQSHVTANANDWAGGTKAYLEAMDKYLSIGCDVQITELDVSVKDSSESAQVTKYKEIFKHAMEWNASHPRPSGRVTLVQIWGPDDGHSWLDSGSNGLLYNSSYQEKSAYKGLKELVPENEWGDGDAYVDEGSTPPKALEVDDDGYWFHYTFENGSENFSGRASETVAQTGTASYAGDKSLLVSSRNDSWNGATHSLSTNPFKPGEEFSFSVAVMYDDGPETSKFHLTLSYGSGDDTVYTKIASEDVTKGQWTQLSNTNFKIPSGASNMQIYVETEGDDEQDFYIDEMIGAPAGTVITGPKAVPAILGDVTCDGEINAADLSALKAAVRNDGKFASNKAKKNADVNQSKKVNEKDVQMLLEYLLKKRTEFEQGEIEVEEIDFTKMAGAFSGVKYATSTKKDNENNPCTTQRFGADPGWMVYDGRLYLYTTNDAYEYNGAGQMQENSYNSGTINCISSADLVNWTDHGAIPVAAQNNRTQNGAAKWANRAWAPDALHKKIGGKEKFFLYFANSGSGVGVLTADSPTGPWTDPIGTELVSKSNTPNMSDVVWMFDPGVYYDEETDEAYLFMGGGVDGKPKDYPKTGRCMKLNGDMVSIDKNSVTVLENPYLFEDSSLIKIDGWWYYSYCSNFDVPGGTNINGVTFNSGEILAMRSKSPLGPWTKSQLLCRVLPGTGNGGMNLDGGGNNHHSIIEFKGEYYVAYHARTTERRLGVNNGNGLNYRSTHINKASYNPSNGQITCKGDMAGCSQLEYLNPYQTVQAETMANQGGIQIKGLGDTVVTDIQKGDWIKVQGVDFKNGCTTFAARASSKNGAVIKVTKGSPDGEAFAYIEVPAGGSMTDIAPVKCNNIEGVTDICFSFSGELEFDSWSFT